MTSERSQAYGRVAKTVDDLSGAKLHAAEQQVLRDAADALFFCEDLAADAEALAALRAAEEMALRLDEPAAAARYRETFARGAERYGFKAAGWEVEARPVRASDESCLRCHKTDYRTVHGVTEKGVSFYSVEPKGNALKAGDPLGVLLYVYKKSR